MTATLGKIAADFSTTLNLKSAIGATSATLDSATDDDGVALPTGTYFLTLDRKSANKEYIKGTVTGTAVTDIYHVSRQGALTSGTTKTHRKGATVEITDFAIIKKMLDLLDGTTDLNASVPLKYDANPTLTTGSNELATVKYADDLAISGSPDATISTKGIGRVSVAPVSAATPIFVGDNDNRVSPVSLASVTADRVAAMEGTGTPNGTTGKYVTNDDTATAATANKVARRLAGGNVTLVTETTGNNTTNGATTAFVQQELVQTGFTTALPFFLGAGGPTASKTYWNYDIPFISGTAALWTGSNVASVVSYVNWIDIATLSASNDNISYTAVVYSSLNTQYAFSSSKKIVAEFFAQCNSVGTDALAWGLATSGGFIIPYNSAANDRVVFTVDPATSKLYAHTSGGGGTTDHTEVEITGITLTNENRYRIEFDPGSEARFYVNGVLEATITTTLPNSNSVFFGVGTDYVSGSVTNRVRYFTAPNISVEK